MGLSVNLEARQIGRNGKHAHIRKTEDEKLIYPTAAANYRSVRHKEMIHSDDPTYDNAMMCNELPPLFFVF